MWTRFFILFLFLGLGGCSSLSDRPIHEMAFASAALKAAERAGAERRSPDNYRKAEAHFWKARGFFSSKMFEEARKSAELARRFAENAEKEAEYKRIMGERGDDF